MLSLSWFFGDKDLRHTFHPFLRAIHNGRHLFIFFRVLRWRLFPRLELVLSWLRLSQYLLHVDLRLSHGLRLGNDTGITGITGCRDRHQLFSSTTSLWYRLGHLHLHRILAVVVISLATNQLIVPVLRFCSHCWQSCCRNPTSYV